MERGRRSDDARAALKSGHGPIGHGHGHAHGSEDVELSGRTTEASQHLNDSNGERADAGTPSRCGELASTNDVDDRGGLGRATPCDLVESALVGAGPAACAFGDVEHDAQARALELISKRAVVPAREQTARLSMQPEGESVDFEALMLQLGPARV